MNTTKQSIEILQLVCDNKDRRELQTLLTTASWAAPISAIIRALRKLALNMPELSERINSVIDTGNHFAMRAVVLYAIDLRTERLAVIAQEIVDAAKQDKIVYENRN